MKTNSLENLIDGIIVISETDSPVVALSLVGAFSTNQSFARLDWDDFFTKYARLNPRWQAVKDWCEANLDYLEVRKIKMDKAEFLYEVFGYAKDGGVQGFRFKTVET